MTDSNTTSTKKDAVVLDNKKQNLSNKKIYFEAEGTEIKIGYDDQTGVGFVEIIGE